MFGNATAPEGLHVTKKYRDKGMQHTCSKHAAWIPHSHAIVLAPQLAPCGRDSGLQLTSGDGAQSLPLLIRRLAIPHGVVRLLERNF